MLNYGINLIFDVGANRGQYAMLARELGYRGRIVSFEPLAAEFTQLAENSKKDRLWSAVNCALGDHDGYATINVAQATEFSSILDSLPTLQAEYSGSAYVAKQRISIHKLDSLIDQYYEPRDRVLLKIDTQGYERKVLEGAERSLNQIIGIQAELSFVPLYEGGTEFMQMVDWLSRRGFTLVSLQPLIHNLASRKIFQADGMFFHL